MNGFCGGGYILNLKNADGCDSLVNLSITELPIEMVSDTLSACIGDSILLNGIYYHTNQSIEDTITGEECYKIRNTKLTFLATLQSEEFINLCEGDTIYIDTLALHEEGVYTIPSISQSGCDSTHTITTTLLESAFQLPQDTLLTEGDLYSYYLDIDTSIWSIQWSSEEVLIDCPECLEQTWSITESSTILLEIYSADGCEISHTFLIDTEKSIDVQIPNIFTPNGDGINDEWVLDMSNYPINSLKIYDRWGNLVHSQNNQSKLNWDGTFQNKKVNSGVYVYALQYQALDGPTQHLYGDITVIE